MSPFSLDRMVRAVEKVRERLIRVTKALGTAGVPHAVVGGNAVAAWVGRVDDSAIRNTPNVDILVRREDLGRARSALEVAGFAEGSTPGLVSFIDGPDGRAHHRIRLIFAGERLEGGDVLPVPDVDESEEVEGLRVVSLGALVGMKLTADRIIDRVHLRDLIDVGLIDESWCERYPGPLGDRLRSLIETPGG